MGNSTLLGWTLAVGAGTTAAVILAVALLVVPASSRSSLFWPRVLWAEVLVGVAWSAIALFFHVALRRKPAHGLGGILPALLLIVVVFAVTSLLMTVIHSWVPRTEWGDRFFLVSQIVRLGSALLAGVALFLSLAGARAGADPLPSDLPTPLALAAQLRCDEQRLDRGGLHEVAAQVRRLRERLAYGLPTAGPVGRLPAYEELVESLGALRAELRAPSAADRERRLADIEGLASLVEEISVDLRR